MVVSGTTTYVSAASYKPFGPLTSLTFGNGTTETKSYTQRYLISENKVVSGSTTLSDVTLTNNAAGFITAATDQLNSGYNRRCCIIGNFLSGHLKSSKHSLRHEAVQET